MHFKVGIFSVAGSTGAVGINKQESSSSRKTRTPKSRSSGSSRREQELRDRDDNLEFNAVGRRNLPPLFKNLRFVLHWFVVHEIEKGMMTIVY